uniref:Uncharacterized protein n=1 Tax=Arundo donax TaxID=35708 RepID=A0A0A8Z4R5_ARUDO
MLSCSSLLPKVLVKSTISRTAFFIQSIEYTNHKVQQFNRKLVQLWKH